MKNKDEVVTSAYCDRISRKNIKFLIPFILFLMDRWLKWLAVTGVTRPIASFFKFALFKNTGLIFSLPASITLFWLLATPVYVLVIYLLIKSWATKQFLGLLFIFTGATSNLIDRVLYQATIDYLIFFKISAINLADVMIVFGLLWIWKKGSFIGQRSPRHSENAASGWRGWEYFNEEKNTPN